MLKGRSKPNSRESPGGDRGTLEVRVFRVFAIFRTNKYSHAMNTCARVLSVNGEILGVTAFLVLSAARVRGQKRGASSRVWTTGSFVRIKSNCRHL